METKKRTSTKRLFNDTVVQPTGEPSTKQRKKNVTDSTSSVEQSQSFKEESPFEVQRPHGTDVYRVTLKNGPWKDLWNGQRLRSGRRMLTFEEEAHLYKHGLVLRQMINDTGKILFVSWYHEDVKDNTCSSLISEAYDIESKAPRKKGHEYTAANLMGRQDQEAKNFTAYSPEFLRFIKGPLLRSDYKRLRNLAFPGFTFGAEQICPIYNLQSQWVLRLRGYPLAVALHQRTDLFSDIERRSHKTDFVGSRAKTPLALPTHIDSSPERIYAQDLKQKQDFKQDDSHASYSTQGIVFLCDLPDTAPGFAYVPGSHKASFWKNLEEGKQYPYLFRDPKSTATPRTMVLVDKTQDDPQGFLKLSYDGGKLKKLGAITEGSYFLWTENSLHSLVGARPGSEGRIRHAQYLSYMPQDDPFNGGWETKERWLTDRLHSVNTGWSPRKYPSGGWSNASQPPRFTNYPSMALREHEKNGTPLDQRRTMDGRLVPCLQPLDPKTVFGYQRPALTQTVLAKHIIGDVE
jgi:hypothetical protein